jgi:hypothetical protein
VIGILSAKQVKKTEKSCRVSGGLSALADRTGMQNARRQTENLNTK